MIKCLISTWISPIVRLGFSYRSTIKFEIQMSDKVSGYSWATLKNFPCNILCHKLFKCKFAPVKAIAPLDSHMQVTVVVPFCI